MELMPPELNGTSPRDSPFRRAPATLKVLAKGMGWTAAIALFGWLCFKGRSINFDASHTYLHSLLLQQKQYASLNRHVLQSRYEVLISYDTLNQHLQILQELHQTLIAVPGFIGPQGQQELQQLLQENQQLLDTQDLLVERFRAENSVLKNSLHYLPELLEEVSTRLQQGPGGDTYDRDLMRSLDEVLQQVLVYNLATDDSLAPQLNRSVERLRQLSEQSLGVVPSAASIQSLSEETPTLEDLVNLVLRHTQVILDHKPVVDRLVQDLLALPTEQTSESMGLTYDSYMQVAIRTTNRYRFCAYIWFLAITGWITIQVIRRMQRTNARTRMILESITDAFMAVDTYGTITDANPQAETLLYRSGEALIHQPLVEVLPSSADLALCSQTASIQADIFDPHRQRWLEVRGYPQPEGVSIFLQDISGRKQAEIAMQEMNQHLERKVQERTAQLAESIQVSERARERAETANRAKSVFLSNMSHELRTPLNAILGFTQILDRSQTLGSSDREHLQIISRSGEHLLSLINDVLELSKIEAGRATLQPDRVDLLDLLENLVSLLNLQAARKGLDLRLVRSPSLPQWVKTDANKLRQVLLNLISNAIKFTEQGQVVLRVDTNLSAPQSSLVSSHAFELTFAVEDTGPGIAPEEISLLFEPFMQTTTGQQKQQGTGLGLSLSRQFVQLLGGHLQVDSQPGQGARFYFTLSLDAMPAPPPEDIPASAPIVGLVPGQPRYRCLIVDDRWENRRVLRDILQPLAVELKEAVDGATAVSLWSAWSPHLIWMDIRMPDMDGYQATRLIREREAKRLQTADVSPQSDHQAVATYQPVKIVAVTAGAFETDRAEVLAAGCDDFVRKPFRAQDLFACMVKHLGAEFRYATHETTPVSPRNADDSSELCEVTPAMLAQLSQPWQEAFHAAVQRADDDDMLSLLVRIEADQPTLAQALRHLVETFQLEALIALTQSIPSAK